MSRLFLLTAFASLFLILNACQKKGCTDPVAKNYDDQAKEDDQSCEYIYGCQMAAADNYCAECTRSDNSCTYSGSVVFYLREQDVSTFNFYNIMDLTVYLDGEKRGVIDVLGRAYRSNGLPSCYSDNTVTADFKYDNGEFKEKHTLEVKYDNRVLYTIQLETRTDKCLPFYLSY
ncbi:hypothetical protein KFE98_17115 [bacterium SCSIO 12741]|nr:hypothetical protein KFE98_17115 [bacterium SCSIO 12741]